METTERADQLVNIIGDLLALAQDAVSNGELAFASHLQKAVEAALMRLAGIDRGLAEGWHEVYRCNVEDRRMVKQELRGLAKSRHLSPFSSNALHLAAEMLS